MANAYVHHLEGLHYHDSQDGTAVPNPAFENIHPNLASRGARLPDGSLSQKILLRYGEEN